MRPWERRLNDLSRLLRSCGETYFDPDLFRQNTNQFLQTARTVTFIIQKNKSEIPGFDSWYEFRVRAAWSADTVMKWAVEARNDIEKQGDLEMYSSVRASLILSHLAAEDVSITYGKEELGANLKMLAKFAMFKLPHAVRDATVLKVERRWVANKLPSHELIHAMTYVYSRHYDVCHDLAAHLGVPLNPGILHPTSLDPTSNVAGRVQYMKIGRPGVGRMRFDRMTADPTFKPPPALVRVLEELREYGNPANVKEAVERQAKISKATFEHFGNHVPMLMLFNDMWHQIDFLSTEFVDQADKFMFWRTVADRAAYQRAYGFVWIAESWIRDLSAGKDRALHELPIKGELLNVIGADIEGGWYTVAWNILRPSPPAVPTLESIDPSKDHKTLESIFFAQPILSAMKTARNK